jgi:predicted anti-sigma-YlaC factor YlaD
MALSFYFPETTNEFLDRLYCCRCRLLFTAWGAQSFMLTRAFPSLQLETPQLRDIIQQWYRRASFTLRKSVFDVCMKVMFRIIY